MTAFDRRLEQALPDVLTDIAAPRVPDYATDVLALTAVTRQRPRWTFLQRWLPMDIPVRPLVYAPRVPWRLLVVAALAIALLAAGMLIAGAQRKVPAPFGPARNGALLFGDGDIYIRDALHGTSRLLLGGPTDDFAAGFTRDGTRMTFLRRISGSAGTSSERIQLLGAAIDGANPIPLTGALIAPDWWDISPDDTTIIGSVGDYTVGQHLYRWSALEPGEPQLIELGRDMNTSFPNFRGPDGAEVVFRAITTVDNRVRSGLFAVHPDGSGLRAVTPTDGHRDDDYQFPQLSPDGKLLAYTAWDTAAGRHRLHILDLVTGAVREFDDDAGSAGFATFSPDSTRLLFQRFYDGEIQIVTAPVADAAASVTVGPGYPVVEGEYVSATFSPDGAWILISDPVSKETWLVDAVAGGEGDVLAWSAGNISSWQRVAP
ncbi:MAG: hypothetical protein H0U52_12010 [Chloroflexi bacterium]|nr:hypothetical protein [Chloroflexota bacterium]